MKEDVNCLKRTGDLRMIQELNRSIILDMIRQHGPISRSEIAKRNKLSPTTVTSAVNDLILEGLVCEDGVGSSSGGRRPILLRFASDNVYMIGVSIKNQDVTFAKLDLEAHVLDREVKPVHTESTNSVATYILNCLGEFLAKSKDDKRCIGISVILEGIVDFTEGVVLYGSKLKLKNLPLKKMIEDQFGIRTYIDNDVNAYLLAEKNYALTEKSQNVLYVYVGNSVGMSILINGELFRGFRGGSGEVGHTIVVPEGKMCQCGNLGCLENYISWPAVKSDVIGRLESGENSFFKTQEADSLTVSSLMGAAAAGDPLAEDTVDQTSTYLAIALTNVIHLFNPQVVVLAGSMIDHHPIFIEAVRRKVFGSVLDIYLENLEIKGSALGEEREMMGTASVFIQEKFAFSLTEKE